MLKNAYWLILSILVIIIDLTAKYYALRYLVWYQPVAILPHVNLLLAHNQGAAFSLLSQMSGWQTGLFIAIAVVMSIILITWLLRLPQKHGLLATALALILGGALGNLWDRFHYGFVVDFIDFYIRQWHFATFNIADAAITLGAGLLILSTIYTHHSGKS